MHLNFKGMLGALKDEVSELGVNSAKTLGNFDKGMHGGSGSNFGGRSMYNNMTNSLKNVLGGSGMSDRMSGNLAHGLIGGAIGATAIGATQSAFDNNGIGSGLGTAAVGGAAIAALAVNPLALGRAAKFGMDAISGFDAKGAASKAHEAVKGIFNSDQAEAVVNSSKMGMNDEDWMKHISR